MSTSAAIYVFDEKLVVGALQVHADGYPSGLGKSIGEFLNNRPIVNGIGNMFAPGINGASNILPQLIFHLQLERIKAYRRVAKRLKRDIPPLNDTLPGQFYSIPTRPVDHYFDYNYHLHVIDDTRLQIGVYKNKKALFYGHLEGFQKFCKETS